MTTKIWLCALGVALLVVSARLALVTGQRDREKAAHALTTERLAHSIANEKAWIAAYQRALESAQRALESAKAQQENASACLDREAKARTDAAERKAILTKAKPRPRTAQEKVVDDATRNSVAARLNRTL